MNTVKYAFPLIHKIGQRFQPILASKYWPLIILLLCVIIYLPSIGGGYFADDNWHRLEYSPTAIQKLGIPEEVIVKGHTELYAFSGQNPERFAALRDKGIYPWWTSESIRINFFRPLSSLTLALDHQLWPDKPVIPHIHSLIWFLLLVLLVTRFYREVFDSASLAGLGALLFAIDEVHSSAAGWISNRHAVVAMVFGLLCLLLNHQGSQGKNSSKYLSYLAFIVALLASEMGLATFAYLFAYILFLERNDLRTGIKKLLPFVIIVIIWRLIYNLLGYGVIGSTMYIDPVRNPFDFLSALLTRYPLLFFSAIGFPIADVFMLASPQGIVFLAIVSLILGALLVLIAYSLIKRHPTAAFWLIGLLCVILPLCASFPRNTSLGYASLGVMGLGAILLEQISKAPASAFPTWWRKLPIRLLLPLLIFAHLLLSPLYAALIAPTSFTTGSQLQAQLVDFGDSMDDDRHVILVNPPGVSTIDAGLMARLFTDQTFPTYLRYLSSGFSPFEIYRPDQWTLVVTPTGGYSPPPGAITDPITGQELHIHPFNLIRRTDSFYYNPGLPLQEGQQIQLTGLRVEISGMTPDGFISQAVFQFDKPLEDPQHLWLWWDSEMQSYSQFHLPSVGETKEYQ